ncbi:MAG: TAT-variant-translocated molybdopterin oxidoreductase [Acidobacteriota bacterium]
MTNDSAGKAYWRSLDDLADSPAVQELMAREFPGLEQDLVDPATRRDFLKILGASLGMVGLTSCRWPKELILPFTSRPEGRDPGVPVQYATVMELGGAAVGLLATSYDGRPIKLEGNPQHPGSLGAAGVFAQASVLELYDPDRSRYVVRREGSREANVGWDEFASFAGAHFQALRAARGEGLAVLSEASSSPSLDALKRRFAEAFPEAGWFEYEPLSYDAERAGTRMAFGVPVRPRLHFDRTSIIVCLEADPLYSHPDAVRLARGFAGGRRADNGEMNRLYAVEAALSLTGTAADHRLATRSGQVAAVAARLARELGSRGVPLPDPLGTMAVAPFDDGMEKAVARFAAAAARDLAGARGTGVVIAGAGQPAEVHAFAHLLNAALGNIGNAVTYLADPEPERPAHVTAIRSLTDAIAAGKVKTLLILGGNPAYDAPADLDFASRLRAVPTSIHLGVFHDETGQACTWHVPRAHYLESWGDARAWDGTVSVQQPLIEALYGGKSSIEMVALACGDPDPNGHAIVRKTLADLRGAVDFDATWRRTLNDGVLAGSSAADASRLTVDADGVAKVVAALGGRSVASGLEAVFIADPSTYDGRFANNAWLQELPDPLSKITWDNAALVSPATAAKLGIRDGDVVAIGSGGRTIEIPACLLPGVADGTVVLPLGYGRTAAGRVGDGVGFDTYRLRTSTGMYAIDGVDVSRTGRSHTLATTQDHYAIDTVGFVERGQRIGELVREGTLEEFKRDPGFVKKEGGAPPSVPLFTELSYTGEHQWGMSIDLSACIGCNACTVACQAENNIPVVGRKQVSRGREMHWIRIDRYFSGKPETPKVLFQPVACQQCENAPCESVCPVGATMHSDEGLNQMVYNRCVGTRYCSNNCPYKVRRFNFFNYFKSVPQVERMVFNPEVTIRARGVMEKCTFCIQRIEAVKIAAKNDRRPIRDGEIVPACAQTCPTQAIVFGDLRDPASRVSRLHRQPRSYGMLAEINTKPRNLYLAKLRNPSPDAGEA